jgi:predicted O-methyltransferase YrrM
MDNLDEYLNKNGVELNEGCVYQVPQQIEDITQIVKQMLEKKNNINIMEIGFNAGHSAEVFLNISQNIQLTSFDLADHPYTFIGKKFIDEKFPGRHLLIVGNSNSTVPSFILNNPTTKFDIIFIDGGHQYEVAMDDIRNCKKLAHNNTVVIMDDTIFYNYEWIMGWNVGPSDAWNQARNDQIIMNTYQKEYMEGRGMAWGKYNICQRDIIRKNIDDIQRNIDYIKQLL